MSSSTPPAASAAAFTCSQTWRVCSVMSPMPAMLPSGRRAVMPEMKTKRPVASIMVACENTPFGWRSFGLLIWTLGILCFPCRGEEGWNGHAELAGEACQHRGDGWIEIDDAAGLLAATPFRLAGREKLVVPRRAPAVADTLGRGRRLLAEPMHIAEMRDVNRDEKMRAVVGHTEVAIERAHLIAKGALRQEPAQEVDEEGEAKALRTTRRQQHASDRFRWIGSG